MTTTDRYRPHPKGDPHRWALTITGDRICSWCGAVRTIKPGTGIWHTTRNGVTR